MAGMEPAASGVTTGAVCHPELKSSCERVGGMYGSTESGGEYCFVPTPDPRRYDLAAFVPITVALEVWGKPVMEDTPSTT